jgi:hypothetical protein
MAAKSADNKFMEAAKKLAILLKENIRVMPDGTTMYKHNFNPTYKIAEEMLPIIVEAFLSGRLHKWTDQQIADKDKYFEIFEEWFLTEYEEEEKS